MNTIRTEALTPALCVELLPLLEASKREVYGIKRDSTLSDSMSFENVKETSVNFPYYLEKQREGMFHLSALRDPNGKLIGHWSLVLNFHGQSKELLIANCENLHIIKEHRGTSDAKRLMEHAQDALRKRGVKQIYFGVNPQLKTDALLRRAGWALDEIVYTKGL